MSLPVLVAIVIVGIALSVAAVHFTGGSRTATLADANAALERFAEDYPDEQVSSVHMTANRETAFLHLERGRTGIVHAVGDCFLTRIIRADDLASIQADDAVTISLRLRDLTWRGGRFAFADPADASAVSAALTSAASMEIAAAQDRRAA